MIKMPDNKPIYKNKIKQILICIIIGLCSWATWETFSEKNMGGYIFLLLGMIYCYLLGYSIGGKR